MILLKNALYVDWQNLNFTHGDIWVSSGERGGIELLPDASIEKHPEAEIIDCKGKIVTHSMGCAHHHAYSALTTGMPASASNGSYYSYLKSVWWKVEDNLDLPMIEASALATALDFAKRGNTFVVNQHSSINIQPFVLETIAKAFDKVGVSHLLSFEVTDRESVQNAKKALEVTEKYLHNYQGLIGLFGSFTTTNKTFERVVALAKVFETGIHMHVAEDIYDQDTCYDLYGIRVVDRLEKFGVLSLPKSILSQCLYLNKKEREVLRESNLYLVQNTESNLRFNVGNFNSCGMGSRVMLGTDGLHQDMLRSFKAAYIAGQSCDTIDEIVAYERLRNIHNYVHRSHFTGDAENNLMVLDYNPHTPLGSETFLQHLIFNIDTTHIKHVISDGEFIVKNYKLVNVDEEDIIKENREQSQRLWDKVLG
jgi:cytosine/adenosine deaminase-related metal-dependent hydrolase